MDLHNEFNKNLLEKNEENFCLKKLNEGLTKQIKKEKKKRSQKNPQSYYQLVNHENHKQLKFLQGFHKWLECHITIQITRFVMTDGKIKRKITSIIPTKRKDKIDNSRQSIRKKIR